MDSGRGSGGSSCPRRRATCRSPAPAGPVLVPAEKSDELVEVSLPSGRQRVIARRPPAPRRRRRRGKRVFVGNEGGDTLSVVEDGREVRRLPAPVQPGGVAVSGDGRQVAVVGVSERALELCGTRDLRSRGKIDVGVGPTHVVARGRRFFVVDTRGGRRCWRCAPTKADLRIHRRTNLPGAPYGITFDPAAQALLGHADETNEVLELTDRRRLRRSPRCASPTPWRSTRAPAGCSWPAAPTARCSPFRPRALPPAGPIRLPYGWSPALYAPGRGRHGRSRWTATPADRPSRRSPRSARSGARSGAARCAARGWPAS